MRSLDDLGFAPKTFDDTLQIVALYFMLPIFASEHQSEFDVQDISQQISVTKK